MAGKGAIKDTDSTKDGAPNPFGGRNTSRKSGRKSRKSSRS